MTEDMAIKVRDLTNKLVITKNLMQNENRASIPNNYLNNIKQLVIVDNKVREDFYNVIRALGTKYNKIYKEELRKL